MSWKAKNTAPGEADKRLLVAINGKRYLLPVANVEQVVSLRRSAISPVPFDTSGRIRGMFNHRGQVVALVRRQELTAASDENGDELLTAVILQQNQNCFALLVDQTFGVLSDQAPGNAVSLNVQKLYTGESNACDE